MLDRRPGNISGGISPAQRHVAQREERRLPFRLLFQESRDFVLLPIAFRLAQEFGGPVIHNSGHDLSPMFDAEMSSAAKACGSASRVRARSASAGRLTTTACANRSSSRLSAVLRSRNPAIAIER